MSKSSVLLSLAAAGCLATLCYATAAHAQVVYSNDFETNTNGFTSASTSLQPTDGQGFGVSPESAYLGRFSNGTVSLALTGLEIGTTYTVEMDLFIGATWDGGGDVFQLGVDGGSFLVNSSFGNFGNQSYSDATPATGPGSSFAPLTGADFLNFGANNSLRYSIYYFSKGAGNPVLQFIPTATTAQLNFIGTGLQEVTDEYWAVDNVVVRGPGVVAVPEAGTTGLLAIGGSFVGIGAIVARRRFNK
ncbi:MAG: hypothetical protein H8F28_25855 [Fibrella sp.]|nr:hypothetical protein [Armatimonadota bacterium]